ncbi:DUF6230 family protein [Streptomyces cinnamoneus]|uniref:Cholesterol esterase n=1 Tax=Streptomyces cinnamoneus TaxID=53446 RepID=A0A918TIN4_STRCJ|nr:DUF6230 family protein [Streptomyces cinnamoneus]GHC48784.1 cholesterol esterase [Streptomyces cinnamoneus]
MKSQTRGGTRWRRFAVVMVPSVAATAAIGVAIAQGALAASFSVSGQQFQVKAESLHGWGFVQYGAIDKTKKGDKPVAVVGINTAKITKLCQAVTVPTPFGEVGMKLEAGSDKQVEATKLYIDADDLKANAKFTNVDIGVSVSDTSKGPGPAKPGEDNRGAYVPGSFAQQADEVEFTDVDQRAWATSAGTFTLPGLHMGVSMGAAKC